MDTSLARWGCLCTPARTRLELCLLVPNWTRAVILTRKKRLCASVQNASPLRPQERDAVTAPALHYSTHILSHSCLSSDLTPQTLSCSHFYFSHAVVSSSSRTALLHPTHDHPQTHSSSAAAQLPVGILHDHTGDANGNPSPCPRRRRSHHTLRCCPATHAVPNNPARTKDHDERGPSWTPTDARESSIDTAECVLGTSLLPTATCRSQQQCHLSSSSIFLTARSIPRQPQAVVTSPGAAATQTKPATA